MPRCRRALPALVAFASIGLAAHAQGEPAKAASARLTAAAGAPGYASSVAKEAAALESLPDVAWLLGEAAKAAVEPQARKALLSDQASTLELLGRFPEAATAWEAAAKAVAGTADARSLLAAAACRLASGDVDAASGLATAVSFASPDASTRRLAVIIEGWAALARGGAPLALAKAESVLAEPGVPAKAPERTAALALAAAAAEGSARASYLRGLAESGGDASGPSTPAALLLADPSPASSLATAKAAPKEPAAEPKESTPEPKVEPALYYQLGAFKDEDNAKAFAAKVARLGLSPLTSRKPGGGNYIVYIEGGSDPGKAVLILKDAGYEAWALDRRP